MAGRAGHDDEGVHLSLAACSGQPSGEKLPKEFQPSKAQVDSVSYLIGLNFGSAIRNEDFGELNYAEIVKGMKEIIAACPLLACCLSS